MQYRQLHTPIGLLTLIGPEPSLSRILFANQSADWRPTQEMRAAPKGFAQAATQIHAYFDGASGHWDCPLAPEVSAFQWRVMQALQRIPSGHTRSYAELAALLDPPSAARAVGGACARNPLPLIMPCHRVVGSQGQLTGFAGGVEAKAWLLEFERAHNTA
jgi:methylated-DNA-[protein]-cysteine S-methyltransferase